jgi:retron-type reverse transcriptase
MERLIAPKGIKTGIFRCLKSGVNPEFPEQGTPQGGVVSPLLANIALNGIEEIHQSVRYADDMVIILRPKDDAEAILDKVSEFLAERGMKVSEKKTKLTATTDGFDFLGWHFKVQNNGKFRCVPSADNFKAFRQKVKHIVNNSNYGATVKAEKLAPVVLEAGEITIATVSYTNFLKSCYRYSCQNKFPSRQRSNDFFSQIF